MDRQVQVDLETPRTVVPALERLESEWNDAKVSVAARSRGYFTPDEEDRGRQMLLACRLRYDWRAFGRTVLQPVRNTRYNIRSQIAGACSHLRTTLHIVKQWLDSLDCPGRPAKVGFDLVTLLLKLDHGRAEFFEGPQAPVALQRIQGGWRPASQPAPRSKEWYQADA